MVSSKVHSVVSSPAQLVVSSTVVAPLAAPLGLPRPIIRSVVPPPVLPQTSIFAADMAVVSTLVPPSSALSTDFVLSTLWSLEVPYPFPTGLFSSSRLGGSSDRHNSDDEG